MSDNPRSKKKLAVMRFMSNRFEAQDLTMTNNFKVIFVEARHGYSLQ